MRALVLGFTILVACDGDPEAGATPDAAPQADAAPSPTADGAVGVLLTDGALCDPNMDDCGDPYDPYDT